MKQDNFNEIITKFNSKGVDKPCPRCGKSKFSVIGENLIPIQDDSNVFPIGGPAIPTIITACDNCGYIAQHAKGPLGLIKGGATYIP